MHDDTRMIVTNYSNEFGNTTQKQGLMESRSQRMENINKIYK